ncbi:hypothetical protein [Neorhodopirellula pilleata]|uniref:Prenyltransferase and squalene oxidase repeat protein n=1 Tax=Neorhodopirellula pilleata TaxID=2714738 RepID=A0A5C6AQT2_9BACT|nr:hypothetical protein [Neorhodopirellula pilleata]TWU01342.1 hypothetical protein Pla100_10690 [Neorhodopirellula pilleata]
MFTSKTLLVFVTMLIMELTCMHQYASAYTSKDPEVVAMIDDGTDYLAKNFKDTLYKLDVPFSGGFGEHALVAYASMKLKHDPALPVVQQGIRSAQAFIQTMGRDPGGHESKTVYVAAVCTLLFAEVDRAAYLKELKLLEKYFRKSQYGNGAYGYAGERDGDVSQTQYAMLALWTMDRAGLLIDYEGVVRTIKWLLRVQDPSGAWPYQGVDPGKETRIKQPLTKLSMTYAGGSALLIAADILRLWGDEAQKLATYPNLPEAARPLVDGFENLGIKRPDFAVEPILTSIKDADTWLAKNKDVKADWPYYNIYTVERYESFREIALKLEKKPNVAWYNEGVSWLRSSKTGKSGWPAGIRYSTAPVSTAFAVLFLSRSTQKAIEQSQEGTLAGGFGLPGDTTNIRVDGTQIKGETPAAAVTDLLDILEGDGADSLESKSLPEDMKLATEPTARKAQIDRLVRLLRGSSSWQARRVAARLLGQSDEIRVVPALIFALDDPDTTVRTFARDGLRFISRKFEGFGLEIVRGDKQDYGKLRQAQRLWREWYLTMDPGYIFVAE